MPTLNDLTLSTLSVPTTAGIGDIVVAISGNSPPLPGSLSISGASATEGNSGTTPISFVVTRSAGSHGVVGVTWTVTFSGTADSSDLTGPVSGSLSFADGETSKTIILQVVGDTTHEPDETFTVTLSAPSGGATLGTTTATGTIIDDDAATTTSTFDFVQTGAGWSSMAVNGGNGYLYTYGSTEGTGATSWAGKVRGTTAAFLSRTDQPGVNVTVDHGTREGLGNGGQIFSGLADGDHFVSLSIDGAYSDQFAIPTTGAQFSVTGSNPQVVPYDHWLLPDGVSTAHSMLLWKQADSAGEYNPATYNSNQIYTPSASWTRPPSPLRPDPRLPGTLCRMAIHGDISEIVMGPTNFGMALRDDGQKFFGGNGNANTYDMAQITGLSGVHTYHVVFPGNYGIGAVGVMLNSGTSVSTSGIPMYLQVGDSITAADNLHSTHFDADYWEVARRVGMIGGGLGIPGITVARFYDQCWAAITNAFANQAPPAGSVAVIALGYNDGASNPFWDAATSQKYRQMATDLLSFGFAKVLCRTIWRIEANTPHPSTAKIRAEVATLNNPNIVLLEVDDKGVPEVGSGDSPHPSPAGFVFMAAAEAPLVAQLTGRTLLP